MLFINTINQAKIRHREFPTTFQLYLLLMALALFVLYWVGMLIMFPLKVVFFSPMTWWPFAMIIISIRFFLVSKRQAYNEDQRIINVGESTPQVMVTSSTKSELSCVTVTNSTNSTDSSQTDIPLSRPSPISLSSAIPSSSSDTPIGSER
eukprot:TRINITY_DN20678_c0_g1_i1.p1 TRINITY_DN20678_c0_g1~~TRINITY_DN20678_c0_g1_i1.p1  ORF type:complete len:150 (+),score=29.58 TRINITY_DN20678_c0_g1_i1:80-529(+)